MSTGVLGHHWKKKSLIRQSLRVQGCDTEKGALPLIGLVAPRKKRIVRQQKDQNPGIPYWETVGGKGS